MKKLVSFLQAIITGIMLLCYIPKSWSQTDYHPIEVKRLNYWAPDYLTVTCTYFYVIENGQVMVDAMRTNMEEFKDLKEEDYIWIDKEKSEEIPILGSSIIEINGQSTKGMSEDDFYKELSSSNTHTLKYIQYKYVEETETITANIVLKDTPLWMKELSLDKFYKDFGKDEYRIVHDNEKIRNKETYNSMRLLWDDEFDWSQIRTYDFAITGNDPLTDKDLFKEVEKVLDNTNYLRRDRNNPQILITLAKESNQSIQSTYVPPTVQTIQTGSQTRTVYNWFTKKNDYITQNQYQTHREGGYTTSTNVIDEYIELCYLDAKRVKDSQQTTPPIIYQQITERHITTSQQFDIIKDYKAALSWATHPMIELLKTYNINQFGNNCISFDMNHGNYVTRVSPSGAAFKAGLQVNDYIEKIQYNKPKDMCTLKVKRGKKKLKIVLPIFKPNVYQIQIFYIDTK